MTMNLIFVQFYGIYGMACIVVITELLLVFIGYYYFKKLNKIKHLECKHLISILFIIEFFVNSVFLFAKFIQ